MDKEIRNVLVSALNLWNGPEVKKNDGSQIMQDNRNIKFCTNLWISCSLSTAFIKSNEVNKFTQMLLFLF